MVYKWEMVARLPPEQLIDLRKQVEPVAQDDSDMLKFEIAAVATDVHWQGKGLANQLFATIVEEVREKARAAGKEKFRLMVRTIREVNGEYWGRKGFTVLHETDFRAGSFGSKTGFIGLEMFRDHTV